MAIINFNNYGGDPRQLYRIRYGTSPLGEDRELYLLTFDFQGALDMFAPFYHVSQPNPGTIPDGVAEEDLQSAKRAVRSIDRVADVVLALK